MALDTETRKKAIERLVRGLLVFTVGLVLMAVVLVGAVIAGILDITTDAMFGELEFITKVATPLANAADNVGGWFVGNVMYIAVGTGDPDLLPF